MLMTDMELLERATEYQSFSPGKSWNEYNGLDDLFVKHISDNKIYALIHDGNLADLEAGKSTNIEYFFDQATYDAYVDSQTGKFDAGKLSEALQVKPYQSDIMAITDGHAEYRNSIACFEVNGDIRTPVGICEANLQFGGGGGHQAFIPDEEAHKLQESGVLKYNSQLSAIHTGQNYFLDAEQYEKIQALSDERCMNCENNGLRHPEPDLCAKGFDKNQVVYGKPFESHKVENINFLNTELKGSSTGMPNTSISNKDTESQESSSKGMPNCSLETTENQSSGTSKGMPNRSDNSVSQGQQSSSSQARSGGMEM